MFGTAPELWAMVRMIPQGMFPALKATAVVAVALLSAGCAAPLDDGGLAPANFAIRCAGPGVIQCFGFDSQAEIAPHIACGAACPERDAAIAASGSGSLRMTIPSKSPADTSGAFRLNFTPGTTHGGADAAYPVQFGEGEEFFVQWRQRFSQHFLETYYRRGAGWKQAIVGEGDRPGVRVSSCTQLEIVVQNNFLRGYAQLYHSCGGKDGRYAGILEDAALDYVADEWMTFQLHVRIGSWYQNDRNYRGDSLIELWVGREGETSRRVVSADYDLANENPAAKYGKIWLLPYHSRKDPTQVHPTAYTWYDELVISRRRIADPQ